MSPLWRVRSEHLILFALSIALCLISVTAGESFNPSTGEEICGTSVICRNDAHCTSEALGTCHCLTGFEGSDCSIRVECNPLGDYVKNAIIRPTPYDAVPAPYGMILKYTCFDDHQFKDVIDVEGNYVRMSSCNGTGYWDPPPVSCVAVCPPFSTWRGFLIDSDDRLEGSKVTYQCYGVYPRWVVNSDWAGRRRYRFEDGVPNSDQDKTATCLSNGTWSPPIPECIEIEYDASSRIFCSMFLLVIMVATNILVKHR